MKRIDFLKKLSMGVAVGAVAPIAIADALRQRKSKSVSPRRKFTPAQVLDEWKKNGRVDFSAQRLGR